MKPTKGTYNLIATHELQTVIYRNHETGAKSSELWARNQGITRSNEPYGTVEVIFAAVCRLKLAT